MKKLIIFIVLTMLIFNATEGMASEILDNLHALGVVSDSQMNLNPDEYITRERFAFMAAHILQESDISVTDTRFSDVDKTNEYSGYIEYLANSGVISGINATEFYPKAKVDMGMACKVVIRILCYEEVAKSKGGYPDGYISAAMSLDLLKNVTAKDGYLTNQSAISLIYNAIYTDIPSLKMIPESGSVAYDRSEGQTSKLLNARLGISVYQGTILSVNQTVHNALFSVEKNKYDTNPVILQEGAEMTFGADGTINIDSYCNLPVTIWVNSQDKIIYISVKNGFSVKYATIDSVNGEKSEDSSYKISHITRMTFLDDDKQYNVKENAQLCFNEKLTNLPVKLAGRFARLILEDNVISRIETWNLKEGGLIQKIQENSIVYRQSGSNDSILNDYNDYRLKVFIDGREASILEIKPNSVFCYYSDSDYLVLVVSERVITGELKGIGENELEIGEFYCKIKDYYAKKGETFEKNLNLNDFIGVNVKAYLSSNGIISYLMAVDESVMQTEFFGVIKGYKVDALKNETRVKILSIKPEIKVIECALTKKTKFDSDLSEAVVLANAGNTSDKGVYLFQVNSADKVTSIKNPESFSGFFGQTTVTLAALPDVSRPLIYIDSRPIYFNDEDIIALYEQDNTLCAKKVKWIDVSAGIGSINMTFYGEKYNSVPTLVLLHGTKVTEFGGKNIKRWGVVSKFKNSFSVDSDGNEIVNLAIIQDGATLIYKVSKKTYDSIFASSNYALVSFYNNLPFFDEEIRIISSTPLVNDIDNWGTILPVYTNPDGSTIDKTQADKKAVKTEGLHRGTLQKVDSLRLYVTEYGIDVAQFLNPTRNFFVSVSKQSDGSLKFASIKREEISQGCEVYYNLSSDGIRGIIVIK